GLHVARAGPRQRTGSPDGSFLVGRDVVRDGHRRVAVSWKDGGGGIRRCLARGGGAADGAEPSGIAQAAGDHRQVPGEGPEGGLPERVGNRDGPEKAEAAGRHGVERDEVARGAIRLAGSSAKTRNTNGCARNGGTADRPSKLVDVAQDAPRCCGFRASRGERNGLTGGTAAAKSVWRSGPGILRRRDDAGADYPTHQERPTGGGFVDVGFGLQEHLENDAANRQGTGRGPHHRRIGRAFRRPRQGYGTADRRAERPQPLG